MVTLIFNSETFCIKCCYSLDTFATIAIQFCIYLHVVIVHAHYSAPYLCSFDNDFWWKNFTIGRERGERETEDEAISKVKCFEYRFGMKRASQWADEEIDYPRGKQRDVSKTQSVKNWLKQYADKECLLSSSTSIQKAIQLYTPNIENHLNSGTENSK